MKNRRLIVLLLLHLAAVLGIALALYGVSRLSTAAAFIIGGVVLALWAAAAARELDDRKVAS